MRPNRWGVTAVRSMGIRDCDTCLDQEIFQVSGGLQWAGVEVVNALSTWFHLRTWRNGLEYVLKFRDGKAEMPMAVVGHARNRRGTEVTFLPSDGIFASIQSGLISTSLVTRLGASSAR